MVLHPASMPGRQKLEGNIAFANIASMVRWEDVVCGVSALWLPWAWLQGNFMVKGQTSGGSTFDGGINGLATEIADIAVALNDSLVVHRINGGIQLMCLATDGASSGLLRVGFAPPLPARQVGIFGFQVMRRVILFVLAVLFTVILFVSWCFSSGVTVGFSTYPALSGAFFKSIRILAFFAAIATKLVARSRDGFYLRVKSSLSSCGGSAFFTISSPSIQSIWSKLKLFKAFFITTFGTNSGENKQGKLNSLSLNSMVQWLHSNIVSLVDCVAVEAIGVTTACGLVFMPFIVPQIDGYVKTQEVQ